MKTEEDEEGHEVATLCSYWRFLQHNRPFRLLFLGEACILHHYDLHLPPDAAIRAIRHFCRFLN